MLIGDSNFLIPNGTFIVELVAFLIVLAFIGKYVLPYLKKSLDERADLISRQLAAAEEARAEASAADDERRRALEEARHQAREIVAQANRTAEQVRNDAQSKGQAEFERIVSSADAEVSLARQRAVEEAAGRLGEMVMDVVERVIGREVDEGAHRDLISQAVDALKSDTTGSGAGAGAGAGAGTGAGAGGGRQ